MTTHDDSRIERVMRAMFFSTVKGRSYGWFMDPSATKARAMVIGASDLERMARAAVAAMEPEPTLEDVLGSIQLTELHAVLLVGGRWQTMLTVSDGEWGADNQPVGWGDTPAEAIRAAVAAARKEAE